MCEFLCICVYTHGSAEVNACGASVSFTPSFLHAVTKGWGTSHKERANQTLAVWIYARVFRLVRLLVQVAKVSKKMPYTPAGFFCDRLIRERERRDGEGSLNKPLRFNGQDYNVLRQECIQKKTLFEDDTFPATVESLGFKELGHKSNKVKNIVWKRPKVKEEEG